MEDLLSKYSKVSLGDVNIWFYAGKVSDFSTNRGECIKYKDLQIAIFNDTRFGKWFACQNLCPHKMEMVLSRGILGSTADIPKIACPLHKKTFSLIDGSCLSGEDLSISTYPVKIENNEVYIGFKE